MRTKYNKRDRFSITKYDPRFRNELGHYQKEDWTSVSDIGEIYDNSVLTYEKYLQIEMQYIRAVFLCLDFFESKSVKITHIYKLNNLKKSVRYNEYFLYNQLNHFHLDDRIKDRFAIEILLKLRLREYIGELDLLIDGKSRTEILFGFDYYMYLKTNKDISKLIPFIEKTGLFVW